MKFVKVDDVLDLFGISDRDIYARGTIEDSLYDGTLPSYDSIDTLPVKHGRWTKCADIYSDGDYECSECHKREWYDTNYCPNCGARMEGEKNE